MSKQALYKNSLGYRTHMTVVEKAVVDCLHYQNSSLSKVNIMTGRSKPRYFHSSY